MMSDSPRRLVIVGAGGHAAVVIEAVRAMGLWDIVGLLDPAPPAQSVLGVPVLGGDDQMSKMLAAGVANAVIAIGSNVLRERLGRVAFGLGFALPPVIHPSALVSPSARIGNGAVVMARAVVGTRVVVSDFAIVNTGAVLDHDNVVGTAAHVAPGCALAGCVRIGDRTLVGVGSSIRPDSVIGADAVIGAGSVVVADVADRATVVGAPARMLRTKGERT